MRTFRGSRLVSHLCVFAFVLFASVAVFAQGPPVLEAVTDSGDGKAGLMWSNYSERGPAFLRSVTDTGNGMVRLVWRNNYAQPAQYLGFAWDLYTGKWVSSGINDSIWYPFASWALSGHMDLGHTGGYLVWIGNQYPSGGYIYDWTPSFGDVRSGKPHKPIGVKVGGFFGKTNVWVDWKPEILGTSSYWIIAKSLHTGEWVKTEGESGSKFWHRVPYGSEAFRRGRLELSLPSTGAYMFFIAGLAWDAQTWSDFETDYVLAPLEKDFYFPGWGSLSMRHVAKGSFEMGSPTTERSRESYESPVHKVDLAYDFYMGKYEVTQVQWRAVMGEWKGNYSEATYGYGTNYPVYEVSWNDITGPDGFLERLNKHVSDTGQGNPTFRLPSEAEWEYACRAGTKTRFFFGDSLGGNDDNGDGPAGLLPGRRSDYMWFAGNNEPFGTKEVGTKKPNLFRLYDMSGNVWEWCQDMFHPNYIEAPSDGSAWISPVTADRVLRGGSWAPYVWHCRSARRANADPDERLPLAGFRLVWTQ